MVRVRGRRWQVAGVDAPGKGRGAVWGRRRATGAQGAAGAQGRGRVVSLYPLNHWKPTACLYARHRGMRPAEGHRGTLDRRGRTGPTADPPQAHRRAQGKPAWQ